MVYSLAVPIGLNVLTLLITSCMSAINIRISLLH